jgi:two-component system sensor histidine kinase KdpD
MRSGWGERGLAAPFALVTGFGALFVIGTVAAGLHGRLPATGVLIAAAIVVAGMSSVAVPTAAVPLGIIGWLTAVGFSRPPYAQLRPTGPLAAHAALVLGACLVAGACAGHLYRWRRRRYILGVVVWPFAPRGSGSGSWPADGQPAQQADHAHQAPSAHQTQPLPQAQPAQPARQAQQSIPGARPALASVAAAIDARRQLLGIVLAVAGLPLLTVVLLAAHRYLSLTDDLLIYLVAVVGVAVVGGFWPAVFAAVAASLLLNWFFTPPLHTFTIDRPENLLALLLFVTVAMAVSSVVHLAARRAVQAARSREEASALLALAQTVLGGGDTPGAVLDHLTRTLGGHAELQELAGSRWVRIAASGTSAEGAGITRITVRENLALEVAGQSSPATPGLLAGFAAQAAAALDRERLRTQAAQAEALAEGNRMRTALLAAVSHDLRTPLASIKASVSSLRQTDVQWTPADQADLLATIEENADRLDGLIGNLLDMSRLHTGSLQPFLRSITVDEVAPVALRGLDAPATLRMAVPDGLPLVLADPGLLERVLANLFSNALRHSPPASPAVLQAHRADGMVVLEVVDHGQGVTDELKSRIFEPFQRFDRHKAGVGLGLAVAKGFTEAMGGSIAAVDTPGGGLTIRVTLPVASPEAEPALGVGP